jgi:hypothetical protein
LKHTPLDDIIVGCVIFLSSIVVVTSNLQFLDCATIVFGWQYTDPLFTVE